MRLDEGVDVALRDPSDLRPLLLAASDAELAPLLRLAGEGGRGTSMDRLAGRIMQFIAAGLGDGKDTPPPRPKGDRAAATAGCCIWRSCWRGCGRRR